MKGFPNPFFLSGIRSKKLILLLSFFIFTFIPAAFSQEEEAEEISAFVTVQQVGGTEMGIILNGNTVYLPVADLFNFLKIKTVVSAHMDSVSGFFLTQDAFYTIDYPNKQIVFRDKKIDLKDDDLILTETNLYLKDKFYEQYFGLTCRFSFRSLTVNITAAVELPVVRELRLEAMRKNVNRLKGEVQADTVIKRKYPLLSFGMADWSVVSTQQVNGPCDNRFSLNLGGVLLGGEAELGLNYSTSQPFSEKEQYYLWRYANNDIKAVRQVMAGKINSMAISSIYNPVVGIQVTNTPTTYRRSFGYYTLSDFTQPGWVVELYVNNVLVDYLRADASGFFTFQVPMVYGTSNVKLKFYGPWGEEKSREQNLTIPYNFLPSGDLEYTASAGFVEDSVLSRFSRGNVNYGLTRWMTIGAGVEYLSSVTSGSTIPFMNLSLRAGALLFSGEYYHGVMFRGLINYRLPSNLQFDIQYIKYDPHQTAINYNILEERKFVMSVPIVTKKIGTYARLTFDHVILPATQSATTELLLSGSFYGVNTNFTTYAMFAEYSKPYYYSNIALGFRLPYAFLLTPQMQYDYSNTQIISGKIEVEKKIFKSGYATASYERNFRNTIDNFQVGLRYDLSGAQTEFTFRQTERSSNFIESARGSLVTDHKTKTFEFLNRTITGRGGIVIIPFIDINCNGKREAGEPKLSKINLRINGGWTVTDKSDSVIRVLDLEPYTNYLLEADQNSIENISWRLKHKTFQVYIDPNQLKLVEIPVMVLGEASGYVFLKGNNGSKGLSRIIVNFYSSDGKKTGSVLTESDGYFSFLGLPPGNYTAAIDSSQLQKISMTSEGNFTFTIKESYDGDVEDNLEFNLTSNKETGLIRKTETELLQKSQPEQNISSSLIEEKKPVTPQTSSKKETKTESKTDAPVPATAYAPLPEGGIIIKTGAFKIKANAESAVTVLDKYFPGMVRIKEEKGLFTTEVIISGKTEDPKEILKRIKKAGFEDAYILKNR